MSFDEIPQYSGAIGALDEGSPNLMNSFYVQRDIFANLPTAGNDGATFLSSDGAGGGGGDEALYRDNGSSWDLIGLIALGADFLVGTAQAGLSAEIVVGEAPGGELGGSWGTPTVAATHSGSPHHAELAQASQSAIEAETNENTYVPPDGIKNSPGVEKAWCGISATGTIQSPSYNIASITDTGTGDRTIVFDTDFSTDLPICTGNFRNVDGSGGVHHLYFTDYAVGSVRLRLYNSSDALEDQETGQKFSGDHA